MRLIPILSAYYTEMDKLRSSLTKAEIATLVLDRIAALLGFECQVKES